MKIGAMNNPTKDPVEEIKQIARAGFDYVDYTFEPPHAEFIEPGLIGMEIEHSSLEVVGHTAFYLPIAMPFPAVFEASGQEFKRSIYKLSMLGAKKFTIHFDPGFTLLDSQARFNLHRHMFNLIKRETQNLGDITIMIENAPKGGGQLREIRMLLEELDFLHLHLDVAHAWVTGGEKEIKEYLALGRLAHLHFSDNDGSKDQHLPLGAPAWNGIPWYDVIQWVKGVGYDDTITLEVFAPNKNLLIDSREHLRRLWDIV